MKWRRALVWTSLLALAAGVAGCAGPLGPVAATQAPAQPSEATPPPSPAATPTSARGAGDTLTLMYFQAPTVLNPHLSSGTKDLSASRITYEPLASFDLNGQMVPILAAEAPSLENGGVAADGRSVTWKLKPGVQWGDGEPFTAEDVAFTYEYIVQPEVKSTSLSAYAAIERVEVIDPLTVKVHFKDVNPAWSLPFTGVQGMIIPRHIFAAYAGANAPEAPANLVAAGTGPYRVVDYIKEDVLIVGGAAVNTIRVIYEPNPYFREAGKPFFSQVELLGGGDVLVAARAVQDGLVDFAWNIAVADDVLAEVEAGGKAVVIPMPTSFVERIMLNFTDPNQETAEGERSSLDFPHPFLTDLRVRQAIAAAINRQEIAVAYGRGGTLTNNLLIEPPAYNSPNTSIEFDPERAAALLDEAGWIDRDGDGVREKDGVKLRVVFQTSVQPLRQLAQEVVRRDLEAVGFEVELKVVDSSIFLGPPTDTTDTRRQFYTDLEEFAFSNKSPEPDAYLAGWTCGEAAQRANNWAGTNWSRYCNPAFDALFTQAQTEMDPARRQALILQMNDLLIEDAAVIPLVTTKFPGGVSTSLEGLNPTPWDVELWNIQDWRRK
jgi:peptide/nickel transport system substrate-binding protein